MPPLSDALFFAGVSMILVHEMDAVRREEWRIFPLLERLPSSLGYQLFTLLHIPIFLALLAAISAGLTRGDAHLRLGIDAFLVFHLLLHLLFRKKARNQFNNRFSWGVIICAALVGGLDLGLVLGGVI